MGELEARQLRYFLAIAEELHFGRAAERLGMAQPPLSRAIGALERLLDVQLLVRTTRQVTLTPAGEVLLREARVALRAVDAAARRTREAGREQPVLRLALKADYDAGLLPSLLRAFDEEPSALPVQLVLGGRGEQVSALHDGRADVALVATPFEDDGLDSQPLLTEPRLVAVASEDPLAARTLLRLSDLSGRKLPDGSPAERGVSASDRTAYEDLGLPVPRGGPAPETERGRLGLAEIFSLIEIGRVVLFVPLSVARRHPRDDVSYREVVDLAPATLTVCWPQTSRSPAVAALVRAGERVAAGAADASHAGEHGIDTAAVPTVT